MLAARQCGAKPEMSVPIGRGLGRHGLGELIVSDHADGEATMESIVSHDKGLRCQRRTVKMKEDIYNGELFY